MKRQAGKGVLWLLLISMVWSQGGLMGNIAFAAAIDGRVLDYEVNRSFNGTSDYLDMNEHIGKVAALAKGTIAVRFKSTSTAQAKTLISASDTTDPSSNLSMTLNNGTVYYENRRNGAYATRISASGSYNDGKWHTVILTVDESGTKVYVDAKEKGFSTSSAFFPNVGNVNGFWIGRNVDSVGAEWHYSGEIAFVNLYDRVLEGSEISELSGVPHIHLGYHIPFIDLSQEEQLQVLTDREPGQYLGHPDSVLVDDGTIYTMYPEGHGVGPIVMKKSGDRGLTWGERLATPASWSTSQETPTVYEVVKPDGTKRLQLISGNVRNGSTGFKTAYSDNNGATWSEFQSFFEGSGKAGIVAMASLTRLKNPDGSWAHRWMGIFHDFSYNNWKTYLTFDENGNEQWSEPVWLLAEHDAIEKDAGLCEIEVIRSPDGNQLALLARAQHKRTNAMIAFSDDEGNTWTEPKEMQGALMGERHKAEYDPVSGRLLITFREIIRRSASDLNDWAAGDWVAWIGTYDDLVQFNEGQYRIRLMEDFTPSVRSGDTGYTGNVVYKDGTYVLTSYGYFDSQDTRAPYIMTVRLKLSDLDTPYERLLSALHLAEETADQAVVGTLPGQYSLIAKDTLLQAIQAASGFTARATLTQLGQAAADLHAAMETFRNRVIPDTAPMTAVLEGPVDVTAGESFKVDFSLRNITAPVQAQDIVIAYDSSLFEFVSAESKLANVSVIDTATNTAGRVHMIIAALGIESAVREDHVVVSMTWRAKPAIAAVSGGIQTIQTIVSDQAGEETNASMASLDIIVEPKGTGIPGDVNGDGKASIGDLGIIAAHYGKNDKDPHWLSIKSADLNKDKVIGLEDLTLAAQAILK